MEAAPHSRRATWGVQVLGLEWNMLHGAIPASWANLRALRSLWLRPGNYQLCGSAPPNAPFTLCKESNSHCARPCLVAFSQGWYSMRAHGQ